MRRGGSGDNQTIEILPLDHHVRIGIIRVTAYLANGGSCYASMIALCCFTTPILTTSIDFESTGEDGENTAPQSSSFSVTITNHDESPSPYTWTVNGSGFWLDAGYTITELKTDESTINVYTSAAACGWADIRVVDKCGNEGLAGARSVGEWSVACNTALDATPVEQDSGDIFECCWHHGDGTRLAICSTVCNYELIFGFGKWKQFQATKGRCRSAGPPGSYRDCDWNDPAVCGGNPPCDIYKNDGVDNCIDPEQEEGDGLHKIPCITSTSGNPPVYEVRCYQVYQIILYFWTCP